jgi:DNA repair exonuclease SbcCD ATPase subunit
MTNEEFEKRMEFIVEQQAQFTADIQQLKEAQAETNQLVNRLAAVTLEGFKDVNAKIDALVDSHIRLSDAQDRLSESQTRLSESQARTDEAIRKLSESQDRLFESQDRTDGALKKLIDLVDRHISEGGNGRRET